MIDRETVQREYIVDIKDCKFSDKDKPDDQIMRLQIGNDLKLFAHRNRSIYVNQDLLRAVFTPEVERIDTLRWSQYQIVYCIEQSLFLHWLAR